MIREILQYPSDHLRKKAQRQSLSDIPSSQLVDMADTLRSMPGAIALAANQIGLNLNVFCITRAMAEANKLPTFIFNPEFVSSGSYVDTKREGCLSFDKTYFDVPRYREVTIKFDCLEEYSRRVVTLKNLPARVFQHEMEHLQGKVFIDFLPEKLKEFRPKVT